MLKHTPHVTPQGEARRHLHADAPLAAPVHTDPAADRLASIAAELRAQVTAVIEHLAGSPARPIRLMRRIGLDKSLASRLVQATRAETDLQFLHAAPSPTGLRMVLDRGAAEIEPALLRAAAAAVDRFETLLDTLPGGRQALDARLGAGSADIRRKREHTARQASFKAQSFLFGHYCDTLATSLFIVPSTTPGKLDLLEVHRRIGLQRLVPDAAVPLMSLQAIGPNPSETAQALVTDLTSNPRTRHPQDFVLAAASSSPLPALRVVDEGAMVSFVLDPAPAGTQAEHLTTSLRVLRVFSVDPDAAFWAVRRYMLHTPCVTLVRDLYLASDLWPGARLAVDFYMPGPTGTPDVLLEPGKPHHRRVNLSCQAEPIPPGPGVPELPGTPGHPHALHDVLGRAGLQGQLFRGWRCTMAYPVPLVEMQMGLRFEGRD